MAAFCTTCCANWLRKMLASRGAALGLAASLALAACSGPPTDGQAIEDIDAIELETMLANGNVRLIDVRRDDEVSQGMIPGAEHIAIDEFDPAALNTSDGREIVLYCRSGGRSAKAADRLAEFTGKPAKHLQGGIVEWEDAGRSIFKPK